MLWSHFMNRPSGVCQSGFSDLISSCAPDLHRAQSQTVFRAQTIVDHIIGQCVLEEKEKYLFFQQMQFY